MIAQWDYGHNAFSSSNLYSGSGPADGIGISTAALPGGGFASWNKMVGGILNTQAIQEGADLLGHFDIPYTPFTAFGLLQWIQPNTRVTKDPLDFTRYDVGVSWAVNKYLAWRSTHRRSVLPWPVHVRRKLPGLGNKVKETPFAVPRDTHAFFLNIEFRY